MTFDSTTGPLLAGLLDVPDGAVRGGASSPRLHPRQGLARCRPHLQGLAAEGIGMLRFDNLGLGDSDGEWGDGRSRTRSPTPCGRPRSWPSAETPVDLLVGHSFGGAAVLAAAGDQTPACVRSSRSARPPTPATSSTTTTHSSSACWPRAGREWVVGGRALTLKRAFVEDVRRADLAPADRALGLPLLVMHSPTDDTVDIDNASEIFLAARHPRSFVALEGSDHLLVARAGPRAARIISAWADQYLEAH